MKLYEVWLPIPGFEAYEASSLGQVRNAKTKKVKNFVEHLAKGGKLYHYVHVGHNAKHQGVKISVHRAILLTFQGPMPLDKSHGCHLDDDGFNNRADNLCWGSSFDNMRMKASYREAHCVPLLERGESWEAPKSAWEYYIERISKDEKAS